MNATANTHRYSDLRTKAAYFRGHRRYGRTTQLVNVRTNNVLIEVMGVATKAECHRAWLDEATKLENLDASVR